MEAWKRNNLTKHEFVKYLRAPAIILLMRTACSFMVGGWISQELFFSVRDERGGIHVKSVNRMLSLVFLSLIILVVRLLILLIQDNSDVFRRNDWWMGFLMFFMVVVYWVVCAYKVLRFAFRGDFFTAGQWLLPLTFIIFILVIVRPGHYQYMLDHAEFYFTRNYYFDKIKNVSTEKGNGSKFMVFDWGGSLEDPRLLVYDESDDIDNSHSDHRRLFEVWPPVAPGVTGASRKSIYKIRSRKVDRHFYVVTVNYGAPVSY